jgi:hypothetical protein
VMGGKIMNRKKIGFHFFVLHRLDCWTLWI